MSHEELVIAVRVTGALVIGAAIGFERTTAASIRISPTGD
jgi:hypothetical protein